MANTGDSGNKPKNMEEKKRKMRQTNYESVFLAAYSSILDIRKQSGGIRGIVKESPEIIYVAASISRAFYSLYHIWRPASYMYIARRACLLLHIFYISFLLLLLLYDISLLYILMYPPPVYIFICIYIYIARLIYSSYISSMSIYIFLSYISIYLLLIYSSSMSSTAMEMRNRELSF